MTRVCVVTGSRSDYGLLRSLIQRVKASTDLELQLVVTGSHTAAHLGNTINEITEDGFRVDWNVDMLLSSDSAVSISKSVGIGIIGFTDCFSTLKPEVVVILGDRYEMLSAASAAMLLQITIAHIHGGEITEGAIDDIIRHCITKMAHLHFVANEEYAQRVVQLGENEANVYNVGAMGIDAIRALKFLSREQLETELDFQFREYNLIITFHPVTTEPGQSEAQMESLLAVLEPMETVGLIFTMPNADAESQRIRDLVTGFCGKHSNAAAYDSLGQLKYLSCLQFVDGVVGNSSSGIIEAPPFGIFTINIGSRQQGRIKAKSIIDCDPSFLQIDRAIRICLESRQKRSFPNSLNLQDTGGGSDKIVKVLEECELKHLKPKKFVDIKGVSN